METDRLLLCRLTSEFIIFYESRIGHSGSAHILELNIKVTSICREFCVRMQDSQPVSNDDVNRMMTSSFSFESTFFFLGAFAKLRKATLSFVMSVRLHGTTRLPLEEVFHEMLFDVCMTVHH